MKLEKIKLAGFKSFVDPTIIPLHSNLTAIVGPNGCGKSNIIDAVRWVMGESSAKNLRGGAMTDVIFNGSSSRKPVSMASVELIFNNAEGKLGGEYAKYSQIAIKRQVSRDGQSGYFLNGSRCRRKDITDLFLGTGLGSRSYAIIEQGTISRMVEAKPDELRMHIEEAAGVSKYKERRAETELRMHNTRENLDRLNDLRDEVAKQLSNLQKQAQKAEQYKALKYQERQIKAELLAMRWQRYQEIAKEIENSVQMVAAEHNRLFMALRELNSQLEDHRANQKIKQQQFNHCQQQYYQVVAEVERLEQTIRHAQQNYEENCRELERANENAAQTLTQLQEDRDALRKVQVNLESHYQQKIVHQEAFDALCQQQEALQQHANALQGEREKYHQTLANIQTEQQTLTLKTTQIVQQQQQLQQRVDKLRGEHHALSADDLQAEIENETLIRDELLGQHEEVTAQIDTLHLQIQHKRRDVQVTQETLNSKRADSHHLQGQIKSLEVLQQHAMAKDNHILAGWLSGCGLNDNPRLAEIITVEAGWEIALETVLTESLQAVLVNDLSQLAPSIVDLDNETVMLIEENAVQSSIHTSATVLIALSSKVEARMDIKPFLAGIYCSEGLEQALVLLPHLKERESLITPQGIWLGQGWLKTVGQKSVSHGILQREKNLRTFTTAQCELQHLIETLEEQLACDSATLESHETQREKLQQRFNQINTELLTKNTELSAKSTRLTYQQQRLAQIEEEQEEFCSQLVELQEALADIECLFEACHTQLKALEPQNARLTAEKQSSESAQLTLQQTIYHVQQDLSTQLAKIEGFVSTEHLLIKQIERLELNYQSCLERLNVLSEKKISGQQPIEQEQQLLAEQSARQSSLALALKQAQNEVADIEEQITTAVDAQLRTQIALESQKEKLDSIRFELQDCNVRQQTVDEQLTEQQVDVLPLLNNLPEKACESVWKEQAQTLALQIERLGAINLSAIDDCRAQAERMNFLNEQHGDLSQALATLDQAIAQIDQESRLRFTETFDKINQGLQEKFPKLFGGGQAYLELTSTDVLQAGVAIIARPPGKRNSSIHLLSGGEKALTAVALVFAIFELNPAPFCLLDEVDAPLDDANVGRFSKMVEVMSETVQFLYISHNKVTMEIAKQLAGVTMKEPGVSRMVAVDIEEAVNLAES